MKRQPDAKWLRKMAREVANEPVPDLDWESVENRVFDRLEEPGRPLMLAPPTPVWPRIAAIAAIAAGIALAVSWSASNTEAPHQATASVVHARDLKPAQNGTVTASAGTELVTEEVAVTIEHEGWAKFRVAADSCVRVQRLDDRVALNLIKGKVDAQVTKRGGEEIFTVLVDGMRVAVRGTIFSVERSGDTLRVEVTRGAVAVGPASPGTTEGWLVSAPSAGTFSLREHVRLSSEPLVPSPRVFEEPSKPEVAVAGEPEPTPRPELEQPKVAATKLPAPPETDDQPSAPVPEMLTAELAAVPLAEIKRLVTACYRDSLPKDNEGVTVHAHTTLNIRVAPDGHVAFARFDPPLAPKAQSCASGVVQQARFPEARTESALVLALNL